MQAIVVLVICAVCAPASANIFTLLPVCGDQATVTYISNNIPDFCFFNTAQELCGDDCLGKLCTYFTNNSYPTVCPSDIAANCYLGSGVTPATSCQKCFDDNVYEEYLKLPASCNVSNLNPRDFCSEDCAGVGCSFFRDNEYPPDCQTSVAQYCTDAGLASPIACEFESPAISKAIIKKATVIFLFVAVLLASLYN